MIFRFGKRRRIRFSDKTHPAMGIASVIIGVISLVAMIVLFIVSGSRKGQADLGIGIWGLLILIAAIVGFVLAMRCYKKEDIYMGTPRTGSVLNGLVVLVCVGLYVMGALV
ncbi:MAG: hypothetical protein J5972_03625 [Eubacterium sp.]|nr:hypothetical protein [Eubacterium sp.]